MSDFIDLNAPRFRGPANELPRGLVLPPPEIRDGVALDQARNQPNFTDDYAKLILDDWTLAYYYEDIHVAYRSVEQGVEVLAVGDVEIGEYLRNLPAEQRHGVKINSVR